MSALKTNGVHAAPKMVEPAATYPAQQATGQRAGWVLFATAMFVIAACLNVIWGIAAVSSSHFFVANAHYILSGLNTWGWVSIGIGAVEGLAALSIWRGGQIGRWFGIVVAMLGVIAAMLSIPAYPFWSLVLVALYVLVLYGLAVYGGRPELTQST